MLCTISRPAAHFPEPRLLSFGDIRRTRTRIFARHQNVAAVGSPIDIQSCIQTQEGAVVRMPRMAASLVVPQLRASPRPRPAPPTTPAMAACPYPGHELTAWPWDLTKLMGDMGEDTNHTRVLAQSLLLARSPNDCRNPSLTLIFRLIDSRLGSHSPTPY